MSLSTYNVQAQSGGASEVVSGTSVNSPVSVVITDGTRSTPVQSVSTTNGTFSATFPAVQIAALSDGQLTASASYNEIVDVPTGTASITKDTAAPVLQSSAPADGGFANATGFNFTATAGEALAPNASSITIFDNTGTQVGGLVASYPTSSQVKVTPSLKFVDGAYTARVLLVDVDHNSSTTTTKFTIDSTTPNAPVISMPGVINASNSKAFTVTGSTTSDASDSSVGEPGGTVTLKLTDGASTPASVTGRATIATDGSWSVTLDASALRDGPVGYSGTVTDRAGNVSSATTAAGTKDVVPPSVRGLAVTPSPKMTSSTGDVATVSGTVYIDSSTGAAIEAGDPVVVTATDGATTITAPAVNSDSAGSFHVSIDTSTLSDGTITYRATASDPAGNASATASVTNLKGALSVVSTSPVNNGFTNNKTTVSVTFNHPITTSGSTISTLSVLNKNGTLVDGTMAYANSNKTIVWTAAGGGMPDAGSTYTAVYIARDSLSTDQVSGGWTFTVKTTVPGAPTITSVTNPINAANQTAVVVAGTAAEVSGTIAVSLGGLHATTSPDASGNWSVTVDASSLPDGNYTASATEADPAGNVSAAGTMATVKDATAPVAPTITSVTNPINAANQTAVVVAGTAAEVSGTIAVSLGGLHAITTPDASGNWSVTVDASSLPDGNYTASATEADPAGNVSAAATMATVKNTAPPAPAASSVNLGPIPAAITTGHTITLSGQVIQGRPGSYGPVTLISIAPSGRRTVWGSLTPSSTGYFAKTIAPRLSGRYYAVYAGDQANLSSQSSARTETVSFRVTLRFRGRTAGRALLGGAVYYAPRGVVVRLYRFTASRTWVLLGTATVGSTDLWYWSGSLAPGSTVRAVSSRTVDNASGQTTVRISG